MASCCASGPGKSMQKFSACKNLSSLIHRLFSTNSACMMAIWPVGPPKLTNPSLSQKRSASTKVGFCTDTPEVLLVCSSFVFSVATLRFGFSRRQDGIMPSLGLFESICPRRLRCVR